jgi:hypothetical protein
MTHQASSSTRAANPAIPGGQPRRSSAISLLSSGVKLCAGAKPGSLAIVRAIVPIDATKNLASREMAKSIDLVGLDVRRLR